jgi:stage III sporulation protein SpoIIIAA
MDSIAHSAPADERLVYLTGRQIRAHQAEAIRLRDIGAEAEALALLRALRRGVLAGPRPVVTITTALL